MAGDETAVAKPVEPVADGVEKDKPAEIVAPEAEAEAKAIATTEAEAKAKNVEAAAVAKAKASAKVAADAKEKAEAMGLTQEAGEPEWAPLKATGEKKASNNLADYGE